MKKIEIVLSPYCAGILSGDDQYIVVKKGHTEEDAVIQIAATSPEGLKKQRDHLKKHLAEDKDVAPNDRREPEVILGLIELEMAKRG